MLILCRGSSCLPFQICSLCFSHLVSTQQTDLYEFPQQAPLLSGFWMAQSETLARSKWEETNALLSMPHYFPHYCRLPWVSQVAFWSLFQTHVSTAYLMRTEVGTLYFVCLFLYQYSKSVDYIWFFLAPTLVAPAITIDSNPALVSPGYLMTHSRQNDWKLWGPGASISSTQHVSKKTFDAEMNREKVPGILI